jgi:predicted metal-binding protein
MVAEGGLADALAVKPYACIGNCERRCRMSVGGPGRWSWLLGGVVPENPPDGLAAFLRRWVDAEDGFLHKDARPAPVRKLLIGRVPPL